MHIIFWIINFLIFFIFQNYLEYFEKDPIMTKNLNFDSAFVNFYFVNHNTKNYFFELNYIWLALSHLYYFPRNFLGKTKFSKPKTYLINLFLSSQIFLSTQSHAATDI